MHTYFPPKSIETVVQVFLQKNVIAMKHPLFAWLAGNDGEASRAYDFVAQRPFWKTRWFLIVLFAVCIVFFWFFFF